MVNNTVKLYKYSERTENTDVLINEKDLKGPLLWVVTWERMGLIPELTFCITLNNLSLSLYYQESFAFTKPGNII